MCLHTFPLVNGVNREKECTTLITCTFYLSRLPFFNGIVLSPPLPPAVRCDTVCDNTNTSFCHCRRANRLIGLPCYPTQTVRPKESTAHFHNVIDRVPRRSGAWKYKHTPRVICMSITSENCDSRQEARRANLKLCCTSNIPPTHTQPLTHQNHGKETGEQSILGVRK